MWILKKIRNIFNNLFSKYKMDADRLEESGRESVRSSILSVFSNESDDDEENQILKRELISVDDPLKLSFLTFPYFLFFLSFCAMNYDIDKISEKLNNMDSFILGKFVLPATLTSIYQIQKAANTMPRIYNYLFQRYPEKCWLLSNEKFKNNSLPLVSARQFLTELIPTSSMLLVYFLNNAFFDPVAKELHISDKAEVGVLSLLFLTSLYYLFEVTQLSNRLHNKSLKNKDKHLPIQSAKHTTISFIPIFVLMGIYCLINYFNQSVAKVCKTTPAEIGRFWLPLLSTVLFFAPVAIFNPMSRLYNFWASRKMDDNDDASDKFIRYSFF